MATRLFFTNPPVRPTSVRLVAFGIHVDHPTYGTMLRVEMETDTGEIMNATVREGAAEMISALNKADLRTNTLEMRILTWLSQNHPQFAGTVSASEA